MFPKKKKKKKKSQQQPVQQYYYPDDVNVADNLSDSASVYEHEDSESVISYHDEVSYDVETFINEMEGYPCLWNTSTRSHHDINILLYVCQ